jgi:outer membrane protein insertion porin family
VHRFITGLRQVFWINVLLIAIISGSYCNFLQAQSYRDFELKSIGFEGNGSFSESQLKSILASKETPWWFWKFLNSFTSFGDEPEYFDTSKVRIDKTAIISFYNANGFFMTSVSDSIEVDSSNKYIHLFFRINEGNESRFGSLNLFGFDDMPLWLYNNMISKTIKMDSSQRYSQTEVQSSINGMVKYLSDNGYLFGDYDSTIVKMDTTNLRADVNIYFTLNDIYMIGDVRITKSGISTDEISYQLIEEIAGIKTDQLYSQEQIDRSQFRLFRTGLFTSLDINPVIQEAELQRVPVLINARIGTLNEISPEIKADNQNSSFNTGLGIDYIRKNFFGDARKLTISLSTRIIDLLNFNFKNIFRKSEDRDETYQGDIEGVIRLEQPFLFGRPILTTTEAYYRGLTIQNQTGIEYGGSQKFDFEMPSYTFITLMRPSLSIDFTDYTFKQPDQNLTVDITSTTPGLGVELASTKTDDLFFPTEGFSLYINPEISLSRTRLRLSGIETEDSSGTTYFYRVQASIAYYLDLTGEKTSVLATKLKSGYIQSISGGYELIPPTKTFFAGGSNSIRGWRARELVPKETINYFGITPQSQVRGGTFLLEGSLELRQKIAENLGFAIFTDYGNTWNNYKSLVIPEIAVSVGIGIRLYTPIAPFRLDFGTKFYDPVDKKMIFNKKFFSNLEFHFGIGEAF